MDLGEVKRKFGQRIALKRNVDCAHLMTLGTPEQVVAATRDTLRAVLRVVVLYCIRATRSIPR